MRRHAWLIALFACMIVVFPLGSRRILSWANTGWLGLYGALLVLNVYWGARTAFRKLPPEARAVAYRFGSEGVEIESGLGQSTVLWKGFPEAVETRAAFYLFVHAGVFHVVAKRGFPDERSIETLRALLREKLGKLAKVRTS